MFVYSLLCIPYFNSPPPSAAYMRQWTGLPLVQWSNAALLSIELLGTNFGEILPEILSLSSQENHMKMFAKCKGSHFHMSYKLS